MPLLQPSVPARPRQWQACEPFLRPRQPGRGGVRPPPPEVCPWTGPVYREEELERLIARFAERAGVETAEMVCAILNKLGT